MFGFSGNRSIMSIISICYLEWGDRSDPVTRLNSELRHPSVRLRNGADLDKAKCSACEQFTVFQSRDAVCSTAIRSIVLSLASPIFSRCHKVHELRTTSKFGPAYARRVHGRDDPRVLLHGDPESLTDGEVDIQQPLPRFVPGRNVHLDGFKPA